MVFQILGILLVIAALWGGLRRFGVESRVLDGIFLMAALFIGLVIASGRCQ